MFVKTISTDGSSADRKVRLLDVPAAPATIVITQLPSSALTVAVCELFSRGKFERTTALPIGPKPPNDTIVGCAGSSMLDVRLLNSENPEVWFDLSKTSAAGAQTPNSTVGIRMIIAWAAGCWRGAAGRSTAGELTS